MTDTAVMDYQKLDERRKFYFACCLVGAFFVGLAYTWWKKAKQQKNREAEQTKKILETDLETFSQSEKDKTLSDLEDKYKE